MRAGGRPTPGYTVRGLGMAALGKKPLLPASGSLLGPLGKHIALEYWGSKGYAVSLLGGLFQKDFREWASGTAEVGLPAPSDHLHPGIGAK